MVVPSFESRLDGAKDIPDIFELVKLAVRKTTGKERSGLMLGLSNLGGGPDGFVGAYYPVATNIIVMNTMPLDRIKQTDPTLYKPYIFHILLHEYIHALGTIDEVATREKASEISAKVLGLREVDQERSVELAHQALACAQELLKPGGHFLVKVFAAPETESLVSYLRQIFTHVHRIKPAGSRPASPEMYLLGLQKRTDPGQGKRRRPPGHREP